jgi:hypothetical protein
MRRASGLAFTGSPSARTGCASGAGAAGSGAESSAAALGASAGGGPAVGARHFRRRLGRRRALRGSFRFDSRPTVPALGIREHRRHVLVLGADDPDGRADVDLAVGDDDLQEDAVGLGLDLLRHLVGVELVERLALRDGVTLGLQPAHDRPGLHALAQPRKLDLGGHP